MIKNYIDAENCRYVACDELENASEELKKIVPCPICKKKGRVHFTFAHNVNYVACWVCNLNTGEWDTPEKAVEAWFKIGDVLKSKAK